VITTFLNRGGQGGRTWERKKMGVGTGGGPLLWKRCYYVNSIVPSSRLEIKGTSKISGSGRQNRLGLKKTKGVDGLGWNGIGLKSE